MSIYTPDKYTILEMKYKDEIIYKVFGTWAGGYLGSDNWRLNSGIERAVIDGDSVSFVGSSGSEYQCYIPAEGVTGAYNMSELDSFLRREPDRVRVVTLQECIDNNYFEVEVLE